VMGALGVSRRRSRADRIALAAAREALADAGLPAARAREAALIVGAVGGGMLEVRTGTGARRTGDRPAASAPCARSCLSPTPRLSAGGSD